uniref:Uncharacterized protein n=1 Tax=Arabidopsis thaliana TaxID=3702 RepID=Q0WLG0_ARATH|nr:hypothetical protein [Arabidopsis thaliana]
MINITHHIHIIVISVDPNRTIIKTTAVDLVNTKSCTVGLNKINDLVERLESGAKLLHLSGENRVLGLDLHVKLRCYGEAVQDLTVVV